MIIKLVIILFVLMLFVGGDRGLTSFFTLVRTVLAFIVNVYLIAWGLPAVPVTLLVCVFLVVTVIYGQNGWNSKMHGAAFSSVAVVVIIMIAIGPILVRAGISGYNEVEQYEEISMYLSADLAVPMSAVAVSATVLGVLGAVMDTAVAVSTAVNEVYVNNPHFDKKVLVDSGFAVGKDILGTTVNTLLFAGFGESIMLANLFVKNGNTFYEIINSKALFQEISALFVAVMGCLLVIPLASLVTPWFLTRNNGNNSQ
ncbi:MAG: YibE/F family protein [Lachnospiraceae bacterium]|nr:YibE/F family protein [Lachnospiraceae bacterium]